MISADAFKSRLDTSEFYNVVCELDGRIVGYISVKQRFQIYHLFVAEQHQGKGIAKKLWSHITEKFGLSKYFVRSSLYAIPAWRLALSRQARYKPRTASRFGQWS